MAFMTMFTSSSLSMHEHLTALRSLLISLGFVSPDWRMLSMIIEREA